MPKQNILFLINPISGGKNKSKFPQLASRYLERDKFHATYMFTEYHGHAYEVASEQILRNADIVVAVGGDGTINEVASALGNSGKIMGIVPYGSGNGLARSLKIPLSDKRAIINLNTLRSDTIDTGSINGGKFFNMAGMGFDAHVSLVFASQTKRGMSGYVRTTISEIASYKPENYKLTIDGVEYEREAFMISIANSSQYGNNAHIAPFASLSDGLLDVCIIKPFPLYKFPVFGFQMFNKSVHHSEYLEIIKGRDIRIVRESAGAVHLDGEPRRMEKELNIEVNPLSLSVLV